MKTIPYSKFKHGQKITCTFNGEEVKDAKIVKVKDTVSVYPLAIDIAWSNVDYYEDKSSIRNIRFLDRTLEDLEEGDVLVCKYGAERKVLGICGEVYFLSLCDNFNFGPDAVTISEMKGYGYTLKQDAEEEEITELTLADVAKLANVSVENLRIKD